MAARKRTIEKIINSDSDIDVSEFECFSMSIASDSRTFKHPILSRMMRNAALTINGQTFRNHDVLYRYKNMYTDPIKM
jgi:hypothetical protein